MIAGLIDEIVEPPADKLVAAYFDPARKFAGATFDTLGTRDDNRITVEDLLAVTLLDVPIKSRSVRLLLGEKSEEMSRLLAAIPANLDIWDAGPETLGAAEILWNRLVDSPEFDGVGPVVAGKIMARKRPRLIPVVDATVKGALPARPGTYWDEFRDALSDAVRRQRVEDLRGSVLAEVALLRLLDAAIWMRYSESDNARAVRTEVGLTFAPRRP